MTDEDLISYVGGGGVRLVSCIVGTLESEPQRNLLVAEQVETVFVTSG